MCVSKLRFTQIPATHIPVAQTPTVKWSKAGQSAHALQAFTETQNAAVTQNAWSTPSARVTRPASTQNASTRANRSLAASTLTAKSSTTLPSAAARQTTSEALTSDVSHSRLSRKWKETLATRHLVDMTQFAVWSMGELSAPVYLATLATPA
jgi:hypothetical protein